jgi:hypothetical protein
MDRNSFRDVQGSFRPNLILFEAGEEIDFFLKDIWDAVIKFGKITEDGIFLRSANIELFAGFNAEDSSYRLCVSELPPEEEHYNYVTIVLFNGVVLSWEITVKALDVAEIIQLIDDRAGQLGLMGSGKRLPYPNPQGLRIPIEPLGTKTFVN